MHDYMTSMIVLIGAIMGIFLMVFLLKKSMPSRFIGNRYIKIIDQLALGSKERVFLLKINQETILVGVTSHGMSTLHVCNNTADQLTPITECTSNKTEQ